MTPTLEPIEGKKGNLETDAWDNPLLLKALIKGLIKELNTTEDKKGGIYYGDETDD